MKTQFQKMRDNRVKAERAKLVQELLRLPPGQIIQQKPIELRDVYGWNSSLAPVSNDWNGQLFSAAYFGDAGG